MAREKTVHVGSLKHKDKRKNIRTKELQDFVREMSGSPA